MPKTDTQTLSFSMGNNNSFEYLRPNEPPAAVTLFPEGIGTQPAIIIEESAILSLIMVLICVTIFILGLRRQGLFEDR